MVRRSRGLSKSNMIDHMDKNAATPPVAAHVVTYALPSESAHALRTSPLKIRVIVYVYLAVWLVAYVALMINDGAGDFQKYRFLGTIAFLPVFVLSPLLKRLFMGRAIAVASGNLTSLTGQSEAFRKVVASTLMSTPWSKHRLSKGRYRQPRFEDIMVLFRDGSHTSMSVAPDLSSVSIVPPEKVV